MFIEQGIKPENKFWKYLIGSILIIIASTIGQLPLMVGVLVKLFSEGKPIPVVQDDFMKVLSPNLTLFLILILVFLVFIWL